ncbi:MAG: hypothetical protein AB1640_09305 [bacterium]
MKSGVLARGRKSPAAGRWIAGGLLAGCLFTAGAVRAEQGLDPASPPQPGHGLKRAGRIDFDERLIMGQSLKAGAIYLFERKDSEIRSMIRIRKDYRKELLEPIEPPP